MSALQRLRARGATFEGGERLHVRCPSAMFEELRSMPPALREELLDGLQDEAEDDIVGWPHAYRRWVVQTAAFAFSEGFTRREAFWMAYRDVRRALHGDRARLVDEVSEDAMLRAALDSGLVTADEIKHEPNCLKAQATARPESTAMEYGARTGDSETK